MIEERRITIKGIPCLSVVADTAPKGVIIFYHGWSSTKELQSLRGRILAAYGYDVLIPEAVHHGERGTIDYTAPEAYALFWKTILQNVEEAGCLLDYIGGAYPDLPVFVMGHSLGGFSALGVLTWQERVQAAVALNGSGWWNESERRFRSALHIDIPEGYEALLAEIDRYDPYGHTERLAGKAVLALHGGSDPTVDKEAQLLFVEKLRRQGLACSLILYEGLGHFVTTNMLGDALSWLETI